MNIIDQQAFIAFIIGLGNEQDAQHCQRFFKSGPGQYGEGDVFLGIRVPVLRKLSKEYEPCFSLSDFGALMTHKYHEIRAITLMMMERRFNKKGASFEEQTALLNLYVSRIHYVNNWDLVDISTHKILGNYTLAHPKEGERIIWELAHSQHLWSERAAVVSNWMIIKGGRYDLVQDLALFFIHHPHDLMHKACGWMLRELGKKDTDLLLQFLDAHFTQMPRTMLRYAIEKLTVGERDYYLGRTNTIK